MSAADDESRVTQLPSVKAQKKNAVSAEVKQALEGFHSRLMRAYQVVDAIVDLAAEENQHIYNIAMLLCEELESLDDDVQEFGGI
ncbi:MAG: hypothetical protein QM718_04820 [Steroidobacteraceae bacterium]